MCLRKYKRNHKFIGFIDGDEYIVLTGKYATDTLDSFLLRFGNVPGVTLNWFVVGSAQPIHRPAGLVGCNYLDCVADRHVKAFCSTEHTLRHTIHECYYNLRTEVPTKFSVDILGQNMSGPFNDHFTNFTQSYDAFIYHYRFKSLDDFIRKNARGSGTGGRRSFDFYMNTLADLAKGVGRCHAVRDAMAHRGLCPATPQAPHRVADAAELARIARSAGGEIDAGELHWGKKKDTAETDRE